MEKKELKAEVRQLIGKGGSRRLRSQNLVPAVFYGPHMKDPISLSVHAQELIKAVQAGPNVLFVLKSGDTAINGKTVLIKDEQIHPLTQSFLHVDLYEVKMDEKIKVKVPVALVGKPIGLSNGGILQAVVRELDVRCLPDQIPDKIEADVSGLDIGDSLHISDVTLPPGVEVLGSVNYTLAAVAVPEEEEVAAPVAAAVPGATPEGAPAVAGAAPAAGEVPAAGAKPGEAKPAGKAAEAKPAAKGGESKKEK